MSGPTTTGTSSTKERANTKSKTSSTSSLTPWSDMAGELKTLDDKADTAYYQSSASMPGALANIGNAASGLYAGGGFGQGSQNLDQMAPLLGQGASYINNNAAPMYGQAAGLFGDTFNKVSGYLDPIASGSMIGQDNQYLQDMLTNIQDTVRNDVGGQFAKAGRSFSGAHANTLGKGMSAGLAAPLFNNYWNERNAQANAINALQGAGYGAGSGIAGIGSNYAGLGGALGNLAQGYGSIPGLYDAIAANKNQAALQGAGLSTLQQQLPYMGASSYSNLIAGPAATFGKQRSKSNSKGTSINVGTGTSTQSTNDGGASTIGMILGGLGLLGM